MSDGRPLSGIRILEAAAWTFVPAAGAVLAEWGAEVIKIEPREGGDPQRGLVTMGLVPGGPDGVNYMIEMPNRGKRSIGIDMTTPGGREVVHELAKTCDVFVTSYLPSRRKRFGIDVDDIRAANPDIIYVRGSGYGPKGVDADKAGYDGVSFWSRGGISDALTRDLPEPVLQTPAFGDLLGGMAIAGGIAGALYKRKATRGDLDRRRLAARARGLDNEPAGDGGDVVRRRSHTEVHPPRNAKPACGHLQDQGRPLHHADDAAGRQVLSRVHNGHRPGRPSGR